MDGKPRKKRLDQVIQRCQLCNRQAKKLRILIKQEQEFCGEICRPSIYIVCFDCLHTIDEIEEISILDPAFFAYD
jgi:hypothetical protein